MDTMEIPGWAKTLAAFAEQDPLHAATATRVIAKAMECGVEAPVVFTAPDAEAEVDIIWQYAVSRISVYVDADTIEVSIAPTGPKDSFVTASPVEAAAYVAGVLHGMAAV